MRFLPIIAALLVAACGPFVYKIDVQQGNYVTQETVAQLKKGMSKAQVKQVLGTPLLTDVFHANRWDYYFSSAKGGRARERTRLSVYFEDDKLVAVAGDVKPATATPGTGAPAAPASPATPARK
jgi:outer membrane protein assembly factor BamE